MKIYIQLLEYAIPTPAAAAAAVSPKSPWCYGVSLCYGVNRCYGVNLCYGVSPCLDSIAVHLFMNSETALLSQILKVRRASLSTRVMSPLRGSHGLSARRA